MKALSIMQPWAWLIVNGHKSVENRTWNTGYRGPLLIHAGKKLDREGWHWVRQTFPNLRLPERFDMGGIVGRALLERVVTELPGDPWFFGPYGFLLRNVIPLPFRPCKGQLGFFDVVNGGQVPEGVA